MAADGVPGAKGNPQFLGGGPPATAVDENLISQWAADNIDRRVANTTARDAIAFKYEGMIVQTQDTNTIWLCTNPAGGGTWLKVVAATDVFAEAAGRVAAGGNTTGNTVVTFPVGRFAVTPIVTAALTSIAANCQVACSLASATQMTVQTYTISTGAAITGVSFDWTARQMTPTLAAG
ncbi:MAG: hypothetical protein ABJB03_00565 [Rhodoglobus sp.]